MSMTATIEYNIIKIYGTNRVVVNGSGKMAATATAKRNSELNDINMIHNDDNDHDDNDESIPTTTTTTDAVTRRATEFRHLIVSITASC